jgi:hypothetical protein
MAKIPAAEHIAAPTTQATTAHPNPATTGAETRREYRRPLNQLPQISLRCQQQVQKPEAPGEETQDLIDYLDEQIFDEEMTQPVQEDTQVGEETQSIIHSLDQEVFSEQSDTESGERTRSLIDFLNAEMFRRDAAFTTGEHTQSLINFLDAEMFGESSPSTGGERTKSLINFLDGEMFGRNATFTIGEHTQSLVQFLDAEMFGEGNPSTHGERTKSLINFLDAEIFGKDLSPPAPHMPWLPEELTTTPVAPTRKHLRQPKHKRVFKERMESPGSPVMSPAPSTQACDRPPSKEWVPGYRMTSHERKARREAAIARIEQEHNEWNNCRIRRCSRSGHDGGYDWRTDPESHINSKKRKRENGSHGPEQETEPPAKRMKSADMSIRTSSITSWHSSFSYFVAQAAAKAKRIANHATNKAAKYKRRIIYPSEKDKAEMVLELEIWKDNARTWIGYLTTA